MPKYFDCKIYGYYLYFTSHCTVECMHVHASDSKLTEEGSAKFWIKGNGDSILQKKGLLTEKEVRLIQKFIKKNYLVMYSLWVKRSDKGFYEE